MIGGIDWRDHNKNLEVILRRLEAHNITLRREKCEFGKSTIEFHGHVFTKDGLKPSPNKVKIVRECSPPKSKEELVSFLQMMAYLLRYISNFSSRCEPLRRLTKREQKFELGTRAAGSIWRFEGGYHQGTSSNSIYTRTRYSGDLWRKSDRPGRWSVSENEAWILTSTFCQPNTQIQRKGTRKSNGKH